MSNQPDRTTLFQGDLFGVPAPIADPIRAIDPRRGKLSNKEQEPAPPHPLLEKAEGFRVKLARLIPLIPALRVNQNRTRLVSFHKGGGIVVLRIHKAFLDAPEDVVQDLAGWIRSPGRTAAPESIRRFVERIPLDSPSTSRKRYYTRTSAGVHDLEILYRKVNQRFFGGKIKAKITYGRDTSLQRVRIRRLGSYSHKQKLITIHPLLDDPRVPEKVISFTIYHEMLHALQPDGHKNPHDRAFRDAERQNPDYREVMEWQRKNSDLLTGIRKSRRRSSQPGGK